MKFRKNIEVDVHDVDFNGVARASSLMKYIQSAAQDQLTQNGMSYDNLKEMHRAFILSKIKIEFTETVRTYDRLCAISYPCESRGYSWLRCYSMEKNGQTIGRAVSVWALIDTESRELIKVNDFDLKLSTEEANSLSLDRFRLPAKVCEVGKYSVNYADVDQNGHMNNTRYPDMYSNFLPLSGKRIKSISINFFNEAPMGDTLTIQRACSDNGFYYFRSIRSDGKINTEAEIELINI
jgi:acyl-ACP thioesterase